MTTHHAPRSTHLREAHAHIAMHGRELSTLQLSACRGRAECLEGLCAEALRLDAVDPARTRWLVANGVRVESWDDPRWITRGELDAVVGPRCACVMSFDYHAILASTAAFRAAGITDDAPNPEGGVVVRDPRGEPTGLLLENACRLVRDAVPPPTADERAPLVRTALADFASHGFAEVHDLLSEPWLGETLALLHDRGELPARVGLFPPVEDIEEHAAAAKRWTRPGNVELLGGKIFVDGTLNSRTAWMLEPFRNPMPAHPKGTPLMTVEEIARAIERCAALGFGLAAHAIGDGAVRTVLDACERTRALRAAAGVAVRIEHAEVVHPSDIPRFAELGVVVSVQPCHLLYDIEVLTRELPDRLDHVMPLRSFIDSGLVPGRTLLFGSDAPIVRPHPRDSIDAAMLRTRPAGSRIGPEGTPVAPHQNLTEDLAWACFGASS